MKMLKGLEIMGLKQIQTNESAKKSTRLSFFGNLLSGFINAKNRPFQKSGIKIPGAYFSVGKKAPLTAPSTQLKESPVFIRPETTKTAAKKTLREALSQESSKTSVTGLDPKSEMLILRALSAATVNSNEKILGSPSPKSSATKTLSAEIKETGGNRVLLLTLKDPAKYKALQKFVSRIKGSALKNKIELPEIQLKTGSGSAKNSFGVKSTVVLNETNAPNKGMNAQPVSNLKTEKGEGNPLFSKNEKFAGGKENTSTVQGKGVSVKAAQTQNASAEFQTSGHPQKSTSASSTPSAKSNPGKADILSGRPRTNPNAAVSERAASSAAATKAGQPGPKKTENPLAQNPTKGKGPSNKQEVVLKSSNEKISAQKGARPASAAPVQVNQKKVKESRGKATGNRTRSSDQKRNKSSNGSALSPKSAPSVKARETGPVSKTSVPITQKKTNGKARFRADEIISGRLSKDGSMAGNGKKENIRVPSQFSNKTTFTSKGGETAPNTKSAIAFSRKITVEKEHSRPLETVLKRMSRAGKVEISGHKGKEDTSSQAKSPATRSGKASTKLYDTTEQRAENRLARRSAEGKMATASGKKGERSSGQGKSPLNAMAGNTIGQKTKSAFATAKNQHQKKRNANKGEAEGLKTKQFDETPRSRKLHDFAGKSGGKSVSNPSSKTENETILEFGKPGAETKGQKKVSEAAINAHSIHPKEMRLSEKWTPLVSRITELIQKFKASAKQNSVKTSFKISTGGAGEVEIQLNEKTKEKTIKIMVESDKVRGELQKNLPQIQQNLLLKGIEFNSIAIDTSPLGSKMNQAQDPPRGTHKSKSKQSKEVADEQEQPTVKKKNYGYNTIEVIA